MTVENKSFNTKCFVYINYRKYFELQIDFSFSCTVSGWGKNAFNGTYQSIIKEVEVKVVTSAECQTSLRTTKLGNLFLLDTKSFMCAGGEAGKDACVVSKIKVICISVKLNFVSLYPQL